MLEKHGPSNTAGSNSPQGLGFPTPSTGQGFTGVVLRPGESDMGGAQKPVFHTVPQHARVQRKFKSNFSVVHKAGRTA